MQRDCLVVLGQREDLEIGESLDLEAMLASRVPPDLWASLVFLARLVWKEYLDPRATEAREERSDHRVQSASLETKEREDQWVFQVLKVLAEPKETRASKEKSGRRETLVTPALRDWLVRKVKRVCLVSPAPKDSKESGVILGIMDPLETRVSLETWDRQDCPVLGDSMESEEFPACPAFREQQDAMHPTSILLKWY